MANDLDDPLIREINDELKQEKLEKLWKAYGGYAVGGALAVVAGVAGVQAWFSYDLNQRTEASQRFAQAQALSVKDKSADAIAAFEVIAKDGGSYALLSRFRATALLGSSGNTSLAIAAYSAIANDTDVEPLYRDLAVVLGSFQELNTSAEKSAGLSDRVQVLAKGDGPWRLSAKEAVALFALARGDLKSAHTLYAELAEDASVPQALRERANEMSKITGK